MKTFILILITLLSVNFGVKSQTATGTLKHNSVYLDLGGYAFWYSLNYEHKISLSANNRIGLGGGISMMPISKNANFLMGISANYLYGNIHNLEIGISPAYNFTEKESLFTPRIGYRYEAPKGFLFRIGLSPVFSKMNDEFGKFEGTVIPWGYISLGYSF